MSYVLIAAVVIMVFVYRFLQTFKSVPRSRPKCLDDPSLGVHKFFKSGGVKIHYVESGDTSKPLILFVHGFPDFWYTWKHQIKFFNKNYHVVALDMRGYSESDKPAGVSNYFIGNLVEDLKNLADHVNKPNFHLVGHDWGGAVSWYFTGTYPGMVKSYTACNMPHVTSLRDQQNGSWEQKLKSWYILFFQLPVFPEYMMMKNDRHCFNQFFEDAGLEKDEELINSYKYTFNEFTTWNRTINYYRSAVRSVIFNKKGLTPYAKGLKNIQVPVMSLFGTADKYLSVAAAQGSSKYCTNHKLELVPDVSHWIQHQAPDIVCEKIEEFIKQHE